MNAYLINMKYFDNFDKLKELSKNFAKKQKFYDNHQEIRFGKFIDNIASDEIDNWMNKFLAWEKKYEEFRYKFRNEESESRIFNEVIKILEKKGKPIKIKETEGFCAMGFSWNKYRFKLYCGQGSFWRIWKGRKEIFTSV